MKHNDSDMAFGVSSACDKPSKIKKRGEMIRMRAKCMAMAMQRLGVSSRILHELLFIFFITRILHELSSIFQKMSLVYVFF